MAAPLRAPAKSPLAAARALDNTAVFTYAQWHYPQLFSGGYATGVWQGYSYRYYPSTGHYLGIANGQIALMGPGTNNAVVPVGAMASFECQVLPANCPVATPADPAVALSGFYFDPLAYGVMMIAADGTFVGYNPKVDGTRSDVFRGTAQAQPGSWTASNVTFGSITPGATGAARGTANITATFSAGTSLTATFNVTGVTPVATRLAMDFYPQSSSAASLQTVSGGYATPSGGQTLTIDPASGAMSGSLFTGCTFSGSISVPHPDRNVYKVQGTLTGSACPSQGPADYLAQYYDNGVENQALLLYGTTTGADLNFVYLTFFRNGDGV
ncbi:MAG: hypothetical protein V4787_23950 [Pseudomonadota bacterium]